MLFRLLVATRHDELVRPAGLGSWWRS